MVRRKAKHSNRRKSSGYPRMVYSRNRQTSVRRWSRQTDKKKKAMKPGKRQSRNKRVYYEYRVNRTDRGSRL